MTTLVCGGAGFIGSHLVDRLLADGRSVRVIDNFSTGHRANLAHVADDIELLEADIRDAAAARRAVRGCDAVLHVAAVPSVPRSIADPIGSHDTNVTGTLNLLLAARDAGAARLVFASSSSVYGASKELPKRESLAAVPISPYAVSKLAAESYCRSFFEVYGFEAVALRYFNVFGPRQDPASEYAAVIPRFIAALRRGEPPTIFGDGEQSRDFTYVENVIDANIAALRAPGAGGRVYNIACGERVTLNALARMLGEQIDPAIVPVHGQARNGDVRHSHADIALARRELGYDPQVGLAEGLARTIAHTQESDLRAAATAGTSPSFGANGSRKRAAPAHVLHVAHRFGPANRYLVTGGAGFIGSHLCDLLTARGDSVVILDDLSTGRRENVAHLLEDPSAVLIEGSVNDAALVDRCMNETDVCVHLASAVGVERIVDDPLATLMSSIRGSNVVMRAAARERKRVLFASTSEVYGKHSNGALDEEADLIFGSPAKGRWTYAIAKCFGEALTHAYHREHALDAIVVRLFNTVGARQSGVYGMVLPRFVRQALAGSDLSVHGNGTQTRCFTHVADTVAALALLLDEPSADGRAFNIGNPAPVTIRKLAESVIERTHSSSNIALVPYEQAYNPGFEELGRRTPDVSALRELTGWQPTRTLSQAIDDVVAHQMRSATVLEQSAAVDVA